MTQESRVLRSLETFGIDVNQALQNNLLSRDQTETIGSALRTIQTKLSAHYNSFAPINKLPPEILGRIFQFAIAPGSEFFEDLFNMPPSTPPPQSAWYGNLMLVCSRWSSVAARCPRMWYYIIDDSIITRALDTSAECYNDDAVLRRSGQTTPLHVYVEVPSSTVYESAAQWVLKNQPLRVEALHVTVSRKTRLVYGSIREALATPFPSLRLLTVDSCKGSSDLMDGSEMPIILGGETSSLEALVWCPRVMFLPGNVFPNLAHLNLHEIDSVFARDIDTLLRLLSNCPRLQTLAIVEYALDVTYDMEPDRPPVSLDHLRALWIHGQYVTVRSALTLLSYLEVPSDAVVRLSNLFQEQYLDDDDEPEEESPPATVQFLAQMAYPLRLDIIHCSNSYKEASDVDAFHFIVVGPRARFWVHLPADRTIAFKCLSLLYKMLPPEAVETLRLSVVTMRSFSFLPCLLDRFSSLTTLLVRHSEIAYPETAASGIASLSRALRPKGDSGDDASDEQCDSSSDGYSDDDEEAVDTSSGSEDAVDLDQGDKSDDPHGTPSDAEAALNNAPTTFDRTSHIDAQTEATGAPRRVPAPQLRTVGLELKCNSLASLEPFARAIEARKTCGHPLDSVRCNLAGVDVEDLRAHVVDGVSEFDDKLWVPTVDEGWLVKNDYWRLYPARWENYSEWGLYMKKW